MRAVMIAVLCLLLGVTKGEAATLRLLPLSSTGGDQMNFSIGFEYTPPASGDGRMTLANVSSYCWGNGFTGSCRRRAYDIDYADILFRQFLPVSWAFTGENFDGYVDIWGDTTETYIQGSYYEGSLFGYTTINTCPWEGGCYNAAAVPVPAALPLLGSALAALAFVGWRRRTRQLS